MAQPTLSDIKGGLKYDTHDENKYMIRSRITERKFRSILLYVSISLMLVALQEV